MRNEYQMEKMIEYFEQFEDFELLSCSVEANEKSSGIAIVVDDKPLIHELSYYVIINFKHQAWSEDGNWTTDTYGALFSAETAYEIKEVLSEFFYEYLLLSSWEYEIKTVEHSKNKMIDFVIRQNNSGGYYQGYMDEENNFHRIRKSKYDDEDLVITARNKKEAVKLLNDYIKYYNLGFGYCTCCGERWEQIINTSNDEAEYLVTKHNKII